MVRGSQAARGRGTEGSSAGEDEVVTRFKEEAAIPHLSLGHTTFSTHLHLLRLSPDPFCPCCRTILETIKQFLLHWQRFHSHRTALRSRLSALGITTLDLPTLLVA
ncbi:hypothetical protein E2C01_081337 [Portunus trituberculatus]|uniref:Uncharacterized protein n=1 Tax=Portunus trituberculatus TaxID=210409 RepID=A0A5B7IYI8_PORTR|nr:hypothetical protein [Portunus trituberculatus]